MGEFVCGTHNAAFVQVMYEQFLRDPASVGEEWRQLFDNGRLADLPVIPTSRDEVLRETGGGGRGAGGGTPPGAPAPPSRLPPPRPPPHSRPAAPPGLNKKGPPCLPPAGGLPQN